MKESRTHQKGPRPVGRVHPDTPARHAHRTPAPTGAPRSSAAGPAPKRRSSRRRGGSPYAAAAEPRLTSLPTGRRAYVETREWLLARHGPVCAYCQRRGDAEEITLDHVTPRRGQTAYDRRDNLVLACSSCNAAKKDTPILAFLLGRRERAASLLRYGLHLSPMLLDLARQVAGPEAAARAERLADPDYPYAD